MVRYMIIDPFKTTYRDEFPFVGITFPANKHDALYVDDSNMLAAIESYK